MRLGATIAVLLILPLVSADHPGSNERGPAGIEQIVHHLPDVQASFGDWEAAWPDRVDRMVIGATSSGFPLEGIRITDESVAFDQAATATLQKLRVYLDGGHHGNEYLGVELVMYYLEDLLNLADQQDNATLQFLATTEVYAVPIINVDGNFLDTRKNSAQVDVNRNYDFQWGGAGSGGMITDLNYRGPSPASEAEVRANQDFGAKIRPDVWITMHTGVAEFYWPWGYVDEKAPDWEFFESLEAPFENATKGAVDAMQASKLYLAAGATDDWAYGVLGVPAHTFEVHDDQFIPVYGQGIPAVIENQLAGLDFMVRNVKHMGAYLEVKVDANGLVITNTGWGVARNATLDGKILADIAPGASVQFDAPIRDTVLTYPQMLINTSKIREVPIPAVQATEHSASAAPVGLAILALAVAMRRRWV